VPTSAAFQISSPGLPEVAFERANATFVLISSSDVSAAPSWGPKRVVFSALFSSQKYFEDDVASDVLERAELTADDGRAVEQGSWVHWSSDDLSSGAEWTPTTITSRAGQQIQTFQLSVPIELMLTKLSASKPATHWQRVQLQVDGLTSSTFSGDQALVLKDFTLTIDEQASSEFRKGSVTPPGDDGPSAASSAMLSLAIAICVALVSLF
jgi:hypothetical protein